MLNVSNTPIPTSTPSSSAVSAGVVSGASMNAPFTHTTAVPEVELMRRTPP
jgi:hypothetical protein